ncbi:MAG TPA: enolase C-terminal domain-like protein, partial [Vicinamibacteria bacterium]|nr:enolase C-terminal domain-like protein [Vicinamibacteria bacterium]
DGPHAGHGLTFTNGRGTEIGVAAARAYDGLVVGLDLEEITADFRGFYHRLTQDPQLRWIGPERGIVHMALGAVVNAIWDLWARREGKPAWKLLADLTPQQTVDCVPFTWITDALTPDEALAILERNAPTRAAREAEMRREGFPAYTTSAGWLGYPDEKVRRLCREATAQGFTHLKMKVGRDLEGNRRRAALVRSEIGPGRRLSMDANQCWDVGEAVDHVKALAGFDPFWIEEPTSPDDVLGHAAIARAIAPIKVATGEMAQNRVVFKQLMQAGALGYCQVDACRVGGVNEVLAVLLLAAKFAVPVCPHAGGVGLCEYVQHLAIYDYIAANPSLENRYCEYVDHLHGHFVHPVRVVNARYQAPLEPGYSIEMKEASLASHEYPGGSAWGGVVLNRRIDRRLP